MLIEKSIKRTFLIPSSGMRRKKAELLVDGDYKIYEVADMLRYASQTNFGRNFLKQFGMTISDYLSMKLAERKLK